MRLFAKLLAALLLLPALASPVEARERRIHFRGTLDQKLPVRMTLVRDGSRISGVYLYEAVGDAVRLEGTIDGRENVRLDEFVEGGQRTGLFSGVWRGRNFAGTWSKPEPGGATMPFVLDSSPQEPDGTSGTYESLTGGASSTLLAVLLPGNRVKLRLSAVTVVDPDADPPIANTGTVVETLRLDGKVGVYQRDDCRINFRFNGREVEVQQSAPGAACGMGAGVDATGTFRRRAAEVDLVALEGR
jgi:hypothetical protein